MKSRSNKINRTNRNGINSQLHLLAEILRGQENPSPDFFFGTDWDVLVHEAQVEGTAPLTYWTLSTSGKISALPQSARDALRAAYSQSWKHNQDIFSELEILVREFNYATIPVVVLKGACFALTIYPDSGTRPMGDLDLLVPAAQLSAAVQIAKDLGYQEYHPEAAPGLWELLNHEVCLQRKSPRAVTIEIHKSLVADKTFKYAVSVDWFWTQTQALNNSRFPNLLTLTPTAQLLYAAAHAMLQHGGKFTTMRWFVDLDRMIRAYAEDINWDALLSQAKDFEWSSALDAALSQTWEYFHTPIPENVRAALSGYDDRHRGLVNLLQHKPATHIQDELQKMASLNNTGKLRLAFALLIPSPAYMRWRYDLTTSWLLPLYYLIRWWGIFVDGIKTLIVFTQKMFR